VAFVEPVAARYRTTLVLNLGAMALAVVLGSLAVRAVAQRERLEGQAREETRVRFRTEVFDLFNHTNLGIPERFVNTPSSGPSSWRRRRLGRSSSCGGTCSDPATTCLGSSIGSLLVGARGVESASAW